MRITAHGKFFSADGKPFHFRAIDLSAKTPTQHDWEAVRAAGFSVISHPAVDVSILKAADRRGLAVIARQDANLWGRLTGASRIREQTVIGCMADQLREQLGSALGDERLTAVALAAEVETAVRASLPQSQVRRVVNRLTRLLHAEYPGLLVTYVTDQQPAHPCPEEVDFLTVNVVVNAEVALPAVLSAAHRMVGDRPLVVGEVQLSGGGPVGRRASLAAVLGAAIDRGAAGVQMPDWPPEPADVQRRLNSQSVRDLEVSWPTVSVVICAYNAESTLNECLEYCEALNYPGLELVVVDDGSTDRTGAIARRHPRARLVTVPRGGLSAARNAGYRAARGELIAYLDSDAFPPPEWVWYLALSAAGSGVAGGGGPNLPPPGDPVGAQIVARSPGGPLPRLLAEDRAAHIPGCNVAFHRNVLEQLGGFDERVWGAPDDLEFEWRVLDSGRVLGYHPAAFVWHHRRSDLAGYLRQQRSYGRGQAVAEHLYPHRFPPGQRLRRLIGTLSGTNAGGPALGLPVAYRSVDWQQRPLLDLAHQWGIPAAVALLAGTAPLAFVRRKWSVITALGGLSVSAVFLIDVTVAGDGTRLPAPALRSRMRIAIHRLLRPLAFRWGHWSERQRRRRGLV